MSHPENLKDTLFILTFDESDGNNNNQVYTVLIGDQVNRGFQNNQKINHVSLLKLIEDEYGIGNLGRDDAKSITIQGIWK